MNGGRLWKKSFSLSRLAQKPARRSRVVYASKFSFAALLTLHCGRSGAKLDLRCAVTRDEATAQTCGPIIVLRDIQRSGYARNSAHLLNEKGDPFGSPEVLRNRFRKWCDAVGLEGLSSHGVRKAAVHLLAQNGCSQHQIMTIYGHTEAKTSEIYTKGVDAGHSLLTLCGRLRVWSGEQRWQVRCGPESPPKREDYKLGRCPPR